jgi:hypothetical protein
MSAESSTLSVKANRAPILSVCVLTLIFVAAYFGLRALPDAQCGFLHYEEIVNADGSVEFCATNHAGFLDLTRLKYPVEMEISLADEPAPGVAQEVTLELLTSGGTPIAPHELAITHTKKMHVMVIDPSLVDYHHVHPQSDGLNGQYTFEFTPNRAGTYQVFAEIVPLRTRRQIIATGNIEVAGAAAAMEFERRTESVVDGLRFKLGDVPTKRLRTGVDYRFELDISAVDGSAVMLEDVMGAKGHMVAFDAARKGFAHMHPVDSVVSARSSESESELAFLFNVPNPGWYRIFAQVQVDGREVFGHFDLEVK